MSRVYIWPVGISIKTILKKLNFRPIFSEIFCENREKDSTHWYWILHEACIHTNKWVGNISGLFELVLRRFWKKSESSSKIQINVVWECVSFMRLLTSIVCFHFKTTPRQYSGSHKTARLFRTTSAVYTVS